MKLSPHFTLREMTATSYPQLQDKPSTQAVVNMVYLCACVLEPLRERAGHALLINSGYRSAKLNDRVGGVANSYHLRGLAADLRCLTEADAIELRAYCKDIPACDLALVERKGKAVWLHVQTTIERQPRRLAK